MRTIALKSLSILSLIVLVGAGCAAPAPSPAGKEGSSAAPSTSVASASGCRHPYFPIAPGYAITFISHGGPTDSEYTMSVNDVLGNTATLAYAFSGSDITVTQSISCDGGHIASDSFLDLGSAMGGGKGFTYHTNESTGEWLPDQLDIGSEWTNTFKGTMVAAPDSPLPPSFRNVQTTVTTNRKVVGTEQVTVPAGTYTALKVESHLTMTTDNPSIPLNTEIDSTEYWVKDVGMVKSSGASFSTEAASIMLP